MNSEIKYISTEKAAKPMGHYSQAVVYKDTIYVAAQLGIPPEGKPIQVGSIEQQTETALNNVKQILQAAGSDINKVLKVTIYIADINLWDKVNLIYGKFFGDHKPARAVVPTQTLHLGFQVGFDVIAAL